jgi:hypothetical protein
MDNLDFPTAFDDPRLFGPFFAGPSWDAWRAIIRAVDALPMTTQQLATFNELAGGREPPKRRPRELWIAAGRRAGKDSIASAMATLAALQTYEGLRPGETPTIACLAVDKPQARIMLKYVKGYFEQIELLHGLVERETQDGLLLTNGSEIVVMPNSLRAVRGRTIVFAVLDEVAFFRSDESVNPDFEVYAAIVPAMVTIPNSMFVAISTTHRADGLLYSKCKASHGKNDADVLFIKATTRQLNPAIDQRIIDAAMERDPAAGRAEWLSEWREDIAAFISRALIESSVDDDVTVRPPIPGGAYRCFCDPSGGISDSFTACISHVEGETVIVDCLIEITAPFNPTAATKQIAETLAQYGLTEVTGDRYAQSWVVDAFSKQGVTYRHSTRDRSAIYADALPFFSAGRVRLIDNKKLVTQFANLERRTTSSRDRIDHPAGGHDDLSNACAGSIVMVGIPRRAAPQAQFGTFQLGGGGPGHAANNDPPPVNYSSRPAWWWVQQTGRCHPNDRQFWIDQGVLPADTKTDQAGVDAAG